MLPVVRSYGWGYLAFAVMCVVLWLTAPDGHPSRGAIHDLAAAALPVGAVIVSALVSLRPRRTWIVAAVFFGGLAGASAVVGMALVAEPLILLLFGLVPVWFVVSWTSVGLAVAPLCRRLISASRSVAAVGDSCEVACAFAGCAVGIALLVPGLPFVPSLSNQELETYGLLHIFAVPVLLGTAVACHVIGTRQLRRRILERGEGE